jgi:cation transport regulator ChaB
MKNLSAKDQEIIIDALFYAHDDYVDKVDTADNAEDRRYFKSRLKAVDRAISKIQI